MALAVVATTLAGVANLSIGVAPAPAAPIPSSVTEFQPTLNATNPGAPALGGRWGGRTVSVTVRPGDPSTAIAASESGGLFKTTNGGANWSHVPGLKPFRMADVKYATNNASVVLATVFRNGDSQNPGGIWRSTDGGTTWSQPASAAGLCGAVNSFGAWGVAWEPSSNNVFVGTDCGLARSFDAGATWSLTPLPNPVVSVVAQAGGIVDTCAARDGHRRYTRTGTTLALVNGPNLIGGTGCNGAPAIHTLAAAPQETGVLLAMVSNTQSTTPAICGGTAAQPRGTSSLYESDDQGVTWTALAQMCRARPPWVGASRSRDGDPTHFDVYYSGGLDTYRTTCTSGLAGNRCAGALTEPAAHNVAIPHADPSEIAFRPGTNCPQFMPSDAGMTTTGTDPATCGDTWTMAGGSGTGGYNALQIYEVTGQVHPGAHTDLYFGTQDTDIWASGNGGATWSAASCCEGFFLETPHSAPAHADQVITGVLCGPCSNGVFRAHLDGCTTYNVIPWCGTAWTNPPVPLTGPAPNTAKTDNPFLVDTNLYLETGQVNPPNRQFFFGTVDPATLGVTWSAAATTTGGTAFEMTQPISSRAHVTGPPSDPTVYYTYCRSNCGPGLTPNTGLLKVTGLRTGAATATTIDATLNGIASYCNGQGTFVCPRVIGADRNNPLHLFVVDTGGPGGIRVMESTDGGSTWAVDTQLTNLALGTGNRFAGLDPNTGSQVHVIQFDPSNSDRILVGTESNGIIASTDGGVTWAKMAGSEQATAVSSFFFDEVHDEIIVSTYGRGLWKLDLPEADLSVTKSDTPDPVVAGEQLYYDITVTNNGPDPAPTVVVTDKLPPEVDYVLNTLPDPSVCTSAEDPSGDVVTCNLGGLGVGDAVSFRIKVVVHSDALVASGRPISITNSVTVSNAGTDDPNPANNTAVATTIVEDRADLEVTKLCKPDSTVRAGEPIACTVFVDNHGPSHARQVVVDDEMLSNGNFTVTDVTPAIGPGTPGCTLSSVTGGQKLSCRLDDLAPATTSTVGRAKVTYTISADEGQDLNNVATVRSNTPDPVASNDKTVLSLTIQSVADLALVKTGPATAVAGGPNQTYDLTVTNNGPSTARNVVVADNVPAGVTIVSVSAPGGSCNAGVPGDPLQPSKCSMGAISPGANETMSVTVHVKPDTLGLIHNDARVSSDTFDDDLDDNLATVATNVTASANLSITKTGSPDPVVAGAKLTYTLVVANAGPSTATAVKVTDTLPGNTTFVSGVDGNGATVCALVQPGVVVCELGTMAPGTSKTVYIEVLVAPSTPPAPPGTPLQNNAAVTSATSDPNAANNTVQINTNVITSAELWLDKTGEQRTGNPSPVLVYTLMVHNDKGCETDMASSPTPTCGDGGPSDAKDIVVTDVLPLDSRKVVVQYVSPQCTYATATHTVTCTAANLPAGANVGFVIEAQVSGSVGTITNEASLASATPDPVANNNVDSVTVVMKGGTGKKR